MFGGFNITKYEGNSDRNETTENSQGLYYIQVAVLFQFYPTERKVLFEQDAKVMNCRAMIDS